MLAGFHTQPRLTSQTDIIGKEVNQLVSNTINSINHWNSSSFFRASIILSLVANFFFLQVTEIESQKYVTWKGEDGNFSARFIMRS